MKKLYKITMLVFVFTVIAPIAGKSISAWAGPYQPPPFIHGKLTCALNVNKFLRKIGKHGTNSASSLSFLKLQRTHTPRFGDVVFNWRGKGKGHAQFYSENGMCWDPSSSHGWIYKSCNSTWAKKPKIYLRSK